MARAARRYASVGHSKEGAHAVKDLRTFLAEYEAAHPDMVVHVDEEVDARWQASGIALKAQKELPEPPIFVFHRLRTVHGGISPFPLVLNVFASRRRCALSVGSAVRAGRPRRVRAPKRAARAQRGQP